ncbi:MAG: hypothetical protein LBT80_05345 [Lactobacillaceae bacterium]|nr:hypothetical protein [Lactobacillaceae bacterium]
MTDILNMGIGVALIIVILFLIWALIIGLIGQWIGSQKGNGSFGFWLSFVLTLIFPVLGVAIGYIVIALQPDNREFIEVEDYSAKH